MQKSWPMLLQLYCCPTQSFPVHLSWYSKPDVLQVTVSTSGRRRLKMVPGCLSGSTHPNAAQNHITDWSG